MEYLSWDALWVAGRKQSWAANPRPVHPSVEAKLLRIKYSEGQTLLTLVRLLILSIALLGSWGIQSVVDSCFYYVQNAREIAQGFLSSLEETEEELADNAYVLYYSVHDEEDKATRYYYSVYYLTGSEGAWGLMAPSGQRLLEDRYQSIRLLPEALLLEEAGQFRFYDYQGNLLSEESWDQAEVSFREDGMIDCDLIKVERNGLYGAVDLRGQLVIAPQYEQFDLYTFATDWQINRVKQNGKYGYIDRSGNVVVSISYDFALASTVKVYDEGEDPADPEAGRDRAVVYVLDGDRWGLMYRLHDGSTGEVTWGVEPPAEMVEAAQHRAQTD